jgi:hypothetical protein
MSLNEPLSGRVIAVSISQSPDMEMLGLAQEHLDDAMAEVARHLMALGARLVYGGDLRPRGFTELLIELAIRHRRDSDDQPEQALFTNYFPWPVHIHLSAEELRERCDAVEGLAELVFLTLDGQEMSFDERLELTGREPTPDEWSQGLTAMRNLVTGVSDARIVLGGQVSNYKGWMPGVAEESLAALGAGQPLFLLGGFGGCARDIAENLRLSPANGERRGWPGRVQFANFTAGALRNGLDDEENATLATTVHIEQAVALILRGLLRKSNGAPAEA